MSNARFLTGLAKFCVYLRILVCVPCHYAVRPRLFRSPVAFVRFLLRAARLLLAFRHNKVVRVRDGFKLHLYLPAFPGQAFYHALESKLLRSPPGPTTVVFSMTRACSYHCVHCYQRHDAGADLEETRLIEAARGLVDAGVALFDIEGGEPFARHDRLLKLVRSLDARCEIWVNTTGTTPAQLRAAADAGLYGIMVSIHATSAAAHDAFTGVEGAFEAACSVMRDARELGLATAVNTVLSEQDLRSGGLDRMMTLARGLDADFVQLIHPKPAGAWLEHKEAMQTDPELLRNLRREHLRYNRGTTRAFPALAAQVFEESPKVFGCTAGAIDRLYIGAGGEVQPCEFLNLSFGNVGSEPLEDILQRMRSWFPHPCEDWLCCTQAAAIGKLVHDHSLAATPVPWPIALQLVSHWDRGAPTRLYRKLGIYRAKPARLNTGQP